MTPDSAYHTAMASMAWPAFPAPWAANKLALLFQIEQNQWRAPEELIARQLDQARQVIRFAAATVPYYRQQLGNNYQATGLKQENWSEVPILSRKALHEAKASMRSDSLPVEHGRTFSIETSGSTGMVVEVLGTDLTRLFWQVFCLRDHLWHRRDLTQKLCTIRLQRDPLVKGPNGMTAAGWGPATDDVAVTGTSVNYDIGLDIAHLAERLVLDRPGYLLGHPSTILELARLCLSKEILLPGLREVRTLGESAHESLRQRCRDAWGVPLIDMYSCQEAGYLALQCPEQGHYHVQSENVLLEVVDDNGRACASGEIGRVLITSLNNFATPLIRYELGDYAEVGKPCSCGRNLPVLKRIMGRYRNLITLPDGSRRWADVGFPDHIGPIDQMQMIQTALDELQVRLVMPRPLTDSEANSLSAFIHDNLGYPFRLRFEYVDTIRNSANGKVEQVISLIGP